MGMSVSTPSPMMVVTHTLSFIRPLSVHVSRSSRLREMQRNSQFGEMQWQSCRQLSIEVAVWLVQGNGASAHMLLQCVAALQSYRGPHGGHLVAEMR